MTPGAADGAAVPVVKVLAGNSIQLLIDGAICALQWNITWEDGPGGPTTFYASANNPGSGSGFEAENRWAFTPGS